MADLWERMRKTVSEIYTTASGKAVEGVNLGVKKLDEVTIRRELTREFAGLGGRTYQLLKRDEAGAVATDPTVQHHMTRLEELEKRLEDKEKEIQEILNADAARSGKTDEPAAEAGAGAGATAADTGAGAAGPSGAGAASTPGTPEPESQTPPRPDTEPSGPKPE